MTSVSLPAAVTAIGEWAFSNCSGLTSFNSPVGVTEIPYCCFYNEGNYYNVHDYRNYHGIHNDHHNNIGNRDKCIGNADKRNNNTQ